MLIHNLSTSFKLVSNCSVDHRESRTAILKCPFHALTHLRIQNVLFETHPWECANTIHTDKKEKHRLYTNTMFYFFINYTKMYLVCMNYASKSDHSMSCSKLASWLYRPSTIKSQISEQKTIFNVNFIKINT